MSSDHSSRLGYVMLLVLLVLWPVMIFVRQRRQSLVYQPMSDEDFVLAVVGIVGAWWPRPLPTGGGLGTKMGIYVKESDYEQARPIAERIMQRVG